MAQHHMAQRTFLLCAALLMAAPAWAVNKCVGPNGQTIFQDAPCPGWGVTVAEDVAHKQAAAAQKRANEEKAAAARKANEDNEREARRSEIHKKVHAAMEANDAVISKARAACSGGFADYPVIGMSEHSFQNCTTWGLLTRPDRVNQTETALGISKQFVYPAGREIRYLYVNDGRVSAIQR